MEQEQGAEAEEAIPLEATMVATEEYGATHLSGRILGLLAEVVRVAQVLRPQPLMELLAHRENLVVATEAGAEVLMLAEVEARQVWQVATEESLAGAAVAEETLTLAVQAEREPEERCVYGPGNSKYSRATWDNCAEAEHSDFYIFWNLDETARL